MSADPQPVAVPQGVAVRLAAFLIDFVAMSLSTSAVAGGLGLNVPSSQEVLKNPFSWWLLTIVVVQLVYLTVLEGAFATTLGKRAWRLRVVSVGDWSDCGWPRALVRNLVLPLDEAFLCLPGVIAIIGTAHRQRVGDLLAGTTVVRFVPAGVAAIPTSASSPRPVVSVSPRQAAVLLPAAAEAPGGAADGGGDDAAVNEPPLLETGWHRSQGGREVGPLTWDELWDMAVAGTLAKDDLVWHENYSADWVPAGEVAELAAAFASRPTA